MPRVRFAVATAAAVVLTASNAAATCWPMQDEQGRVTGECCQAPGGPASCREYVRIERDRDVVATVPQVKVEPNWRSTTFAEIGAGAVARIDAGPESTRASGGVSINAALFWRADYDASSFADGTPVPEFLILGTMGVAALPRSAFLGNERGAELRADVTWAAESPARVLLLFTPRLRVVPKDGRWRVSSLLGVVVPRVGIERRRDRRPNFVIGMPTLSGAWLLEEDLAVEATFGMVHGFGAEGRSSAAMLDVRLVAF